jgi:hypothetical protein
MSCILIKSDGTMVDYHQPIGLTAKQEAVGGYIEMVIADNGDVLYVNEEGLLMDLPYNPRASAIANRHIVGDVLYYDRESFIKEEEDEERDI